MKNCLTTLAYALFAAGTLNAQIYDYDSANESLTITGKGNSVQDRITLEGPITPGNTVPGTSQVFGDTKTITLKDVWTSPDSIRVKYTEPTSAGNNTTLKLENSRLGASGDFDKGGTGLTLIMDSKSELNLYGNRLTNTTRIENEGYISTTNSSASESSYLWDNKTSTGSSGVLGGSGVYNFGNVSSIATDKDFGLIKSVGRITDLEISGDYRVDGNSANTTTDDAFIVGVNSSVSTEGQAMTISGKLTVEAKQGNGIGILVNQLGSDDVSLENNYSGEITVKAKNAFGIKVGGNAAKDASVAGDIYQLSVGTLNVENTITSGSEQSEATGIYAKSVKRGLSADSITVKGYTDATGIQLTEGGSNISINDMKVSVGQDGNAAGIIASPNKTTAVSAVGDLENITVGNLEVSAGAEAVGILANSIKKSGGNENVIGNITASSTNGNAIGIVADNADITLGGKISASSENGDAYAIRTGNDLNLKMRDGAEISATSADENSDAFAIRSEIGNINLEFEGVATITGDISAKNITLANGAAATINGNIEGETLSSGAEIGTVSGKMKFDSVGDMNIATSVGSLEIGTSGTGATSGNIAVGTVENSANIFNAASATIQNANGNVSFDSVGTATVNNAAGDISAKNVSGGLNVGNVGNVNVENTNVNVLNGAVVGGNIVSTTDLTLSNGGSATIAGSVSAAGRTLTINNAFNVNSSANTVISAARLAGSGLRDTINNHYDNIFGFSATDDSTGSLTAETALKGTHNVSSNNITGIIDGDLATIQNPYINIKFINIGENVGYEILSNSYLSDAVATNEAERALAEIYDNLEYVEGDDAANAASVAKKRNFAALAGRGALSALTPQSVVHSIRMNMDLADIIHLDTLNRTSATRDMLQAYADSGNAEDAWNSTVSVRNINRFATYGGDENIDGSNDYIYGGLANVEYAANKNFFAGIGIGGFQAKSSGKGNCGKAETQSIAANVYADWRFFDNFDWYVGATYAFGMNKAERSNVLDTSKAEWDSNLAGVFTGIRYSIKPFADAEFYIKPTIGANANFLMNPSFDEKSGAERLSVESDNYTSVKSLAGLEATYVLPYGFSISGRMFYMHEFCDNRYDIGAAMATGSQFRVRGWKMDRDAGIFGAGIGYDITSKWRVYADYAAEVSGEVYHNINAGLQLKF